MLLSVYKEVVSSEVETQHKFHISKHALLVTGVSKTLIDSDYEIPSSSAFPAIRRRTSSASYSSTLCLWKLLIKTKAEEGTVLIPNSSAQS